MFVIAQHEISDPGSFSNSVKQATPEIPADMKLLQFLPNADGTAAVCLWEAGSVDKVRQLVDTALGQFSTNTYYEVAGANAVGLPTPTR